MSDSQGPTVTLEILEGQYAVTRLEPDAPIPEALWAEFGSSSLVSITRTTRELSIVTPVDRHLDGLVDAPWSGWYVRGPIPFGLTGVVSALVGPLADASCPVFVISTYDSDVLLVPTEHLERAAAVLAGAGHRLTS